eukprot:gene2780-2020_t
MSTRCATTAPRDAASRGIECDSAGGRGADDRGEWSRRNAFAAAADDAQL